MPSIHAEMTVSEVLHNWPTARDVINRYTLDTCCGGGLSLAVAAASANVDLQALIRDLQAAVSTRGTPNE